MLFLKEDLLKSNILYDGLSFVFLSQLIQFNCHNINDLEYIPCAKHLYCCLLCYDGNVSDYMVLAKVFSFDQNKEIFIRGKYSVFKNIYFLTRKSDVFKFIYKYYNNNFYALSKLSEKQSTKLMLQNEKILTSNIINKYVEPSENLVKRWKKNSILM